MPESVITYYWLATIETDAGKRVTCDGPMPAVPGTHTRMTTTRAVLKHLREQHGGLTVLFLSLELDAITPAA